MDGLAQGTSALAVNDADGGQATVATCGEIFLDQIRDLSRAKRVEIDFAGDWDPHQPGVVLRHG
jgi:hypothetical protein